MTTTFNAASTKTVDVHRTSFTYRDMGQDRGIPVVFLHHLTAVLGDWDPAIADGLAKNHRDGELSAAYGSSEALTVARNLDAKILGLLRECTAD